MLWIVDRGGPARDSFKVAVLLDFCVRRQRGRPLPPCNFAYPSKRQRHAGNMQGLRGLTGMHSCDYCCNQALRRKSPPLHLRGLLGHSWVYGRDGDLVAKLAKRSHQHPGACFLGLGIRFAALLDKSHPLMQDLPNHAAESMCDCPEGGLIAQPQRLHIIRPEIDSAAKSP